MDDDDSAQASVHEEGETHTTYKLLHALPYTDDWYQLPIVRGQFPRLWRSTFLSDTVIVTREELATKLLVKLGMELSLQNLVFVVTELEWKCFGAACLKTADGVRRKVVGVQSKRRDFMRLRGTVENTALSVQVRNVCILR